MEEEIMSEYINDPELLKQLNEGMETKSSSAPPTEYVADPELLQQLGTPPQSLQPEVSSQDYRQGYIAQAATTPIIGGPQLQNAPALTRPFGPVAPVQMGSAGMKQGIAPFVASDLANVAGTTAKNATLGHALELIKKEGLTGAGAEFAKAVLHPFTEQTLTGAAKNIGRGLVQGLTAPENLMTLPYNMAAYEQEKIRQNPNAPGLQNNPYAQTVRGEASTQGRAGSANQMRATANMPYGNVTPEEKRILDEDAKMRQLIRRKAFEKVMGPIAPGSF